MIDPESLDRLSSELRERMADDRRLLDELRREVRSLRSATRRIQPRSATAISLVGTDGGNNRIEFDPFMAELIRVVDGFLRSKVFKGDLFARLRRGLQEGIERQERETRRRIFLAGIAKHSKVLQRYRLAMMLEGIMDHDYSCYVEIPRQLEEKAYVWSEYARGDEREQAGGEANKFVAGKMFFVKFGSRRRDPIWAIDLFQTQASKAQEICGYLLADSIDGFPVPFYPRCLQRAHENAALVDFDMDILQQGIFSAIRDCLGEDAPLLDTFRLAAGDPSGRRYQ